MKKLLCEICDAVNRSETGVLTEAECRRYLKRYRTILTQGGKEMPEIPKRRNGKRGRIAKSDAHNLHEALLCGRHARNKALLYFLYDDRLFPPQQLAETQDDFSMR